MSNFGARSNTKRNDSIRIGIGMVGASGSSAFQKR